MCPSFRHAHSAHRASFPPGTHTARQTAASPTLRLEGSLATGNWYDQPPVRCCQLPRSPEHGRCPLIVTTSCQLPITSYLRIQTRSATTRHDWQILFLRMGWFPRLFTSQGAVGGAAGARTPNLRRARAALSRLSYDPDSPVGAPGLEPGTSALSGPRSNQLSYAPRDMHVPRSRDRSLDRWTVRSLPTMEKPLRSNHPGLPVQVWVFATSGDSPVFERPCRALHSSCDEEPAGTGAPKHGFTVILLDLGCILIPKDQGHAP